VTGGTAGYENTHQASGELGDLTGTQSATLGYRLPHALLLVKWEIKGCGLNGLRAGREGAPKKDEKGESFARVGVQRVRGVLKVRIVLHWREKLSLFGVGPAPGVPKS
jgi:hypothetical protein